MRHPEDSPVPGPNTGDEEEGLAAPPAEPRASAQAELPIPSPATHPAPLDLVERRIARASSADEALLYTNIRGELIRQNEEAEDRRHRRWMQRANYLGKLGLSMVGIAVGVGLIGSGHPVPGFFALGAGFYRLAPELTKSVFDKWSGGGKDNES